MTTIAAAAVVAMAAGPAIRRAIPRPPAAAGSIAAEPGIKGCGGLRRSPCSRLFLQQEGDVMTLDDLFHDTLKDIYFAERQILKALPKMAKAAEEPQLKDGLLKHRDETEGQVERLRQVFEMMGRRAQGKTCEAIQGIIEECEELLEEEARPGPVRDAGLIACAQAVEHYEMSRYGTLIAWAKTLGMKDAVGLLEQTLEEEKAADKLLTGAAGAINKMAKAA
jgi:ferritin-like metal-binding protein YciE